MEPRERLSYEEAGRAVIACHFRIGCERVVLASEPDGEPVSVYRRLETFCPLIVGRHVELEKLEPYVRFLMAGTIALQIRCENHLEIPADSLRQRRFRARWYQVAWREPARQLDLAYYYLAAWFPNWDFRRRADYRRRLWIKTGELLETPHYWYAVGEVAWRLRQGETLDEAAVTKALKRYEHRDRR